MSKCWLLTLVALACAASFVPAGVASAQTAQLPEVVEDNIEGAAQFYADQSGTNVTGFTGAITTATLDTDHAVMEQAADRVTITEPRAGLRTPQPHAITIYKNPDPMPTMTATETSLANDLQAANPDTVNNDNKKTVARTCITLLAAASRPASDCESLPIFVVGKEAPKPAENDLAGIARNPSWVVLNARDVSGVTKPYWYTNRADPEPGCLTALREPATADCDEYPYWASMQGYDAPLNVLTPSIKWTPRSENRFEGRALQHFYSSNLGQDLNFDGCDITKQAPTEVLPRLESTFIVLPIPVSELIPTTGICNKPTSP